MRVKREKSVDLVILDVAQDLVQRGGYNAFSYHDLADAIGIKTASIHYYFPTKGDLGKALMKRYTDTVREQLSAIDAQTQDAARKLKLCAEMFAGSLCLDSGQLCMGCMLASDLVTLPNDVQDEVRAFFADLERWVSSVMREGRVAGTLAYAGTPDKVARAFVAMLQGALIVARTLDEARQPLETAAWFIATITTHSRDALAPR